jgi:hypothetical protein
MLNVVMLNVVMLNVVMLNVVMLSVVMLKALASLDDMGHGISCHVTQSTARVDAVSIFSKNLTNVNAN